jgi:sulfide:quinone oxidoreductase
MHEDERAEVVIAGGGVAALEAVIALHELAPARVHVTLVAPGAEFVLPVMKIGESFGVGRRARLELSRAAADLGVTQVADTVESVDAERRAVHCATGRVLPYDSLILAVGGRRVRSFTHAEMIGDEAAEEMLHGILADLEEGYLKRVAFVAPGSTAWTLPVYELALLTALDAWGMGIDDLELAVVTPEERPLGLFGPYASASVAELLGRRGIEFVGGVRAAVRRGEIALVPGGRRLPVQRAFALPELFGPALPGVPNDARGFVPVDPHGQVPGVNGVFAAGDVTTFPVKQGGLAAQQAEAAAQSVAVRHGCAIEPQPFRPVLRGRLVTGASDDLFLLRDIAGGGGDGVAGSGASWWPPAKCAAPRLAPYLLDVAAPDPVASC